MNGATNVNASEPAEALLRAATVLACRHREDRRPSELEIHLREHCHRLKVVQKLSGAHFVISSESSIAIRAYYQYDTERFEKRLKRQSQEEKQTLTQFVENPVHDDIDQILPFAANFRYALILFVYPHEYMMKQLSRLDSFTNRTQRLLHDTESHHRVRILFAAATAQAMAHIAQVTHAYAPHMVRLRQSFVTRQARLVDDSRGNFIRAMRALGEDQDIPSEEIDIVVSALGSVVAVISAGEQDFASIPIDRVSREKILNFFHPSRKEQMKNGSVAEPMEARNRQASLYHNQATSSLTSGMQSLSNVESTAFGRRNERLPQSDLTPVDSQRVQELDEWGVVSGSLSATGYVKSRCCEPLSCDEAHPEVSRNVKERWRPLHYPAVLETAPKQLAPNQQAQLYSHEFAGLTPWDSARDDFYQRNMMYYNGPCHQHRPTSRFPSEEQNGQPMMYSEQPFRTPKIQHEHPRSLQNEASSSQYYQQRFLAHLGEQQVLYRDHDEQFQPYACAPVWPYQGASECFGKQW